jgi:hypothetical protein
MKKILFPIAMLFLAGSVPAQRSTQLTVTGAAVFDFIAKEGYRYPAFQKAKVHFTNADSGVGRLNYNYLLQTMQFIGEKGDTLVFADEKSIRHIAIGSDTFIYQDQFFEKITASTGCTLAKRHSLQLKGQPQKLGAYGIPSATLNIPSEDVARGFGYTARLDVNEVFNFTQQTTYFMAIAKKGFVELSKKNFRQLFQQHAPAVSDFVKQQSIDLSREPDLLKLFAFAQQYCR